MHRHIPPSRYARVGGPQAAQSSSSSSAGTNPLDAISGAWSAFLANALDGTQVALGAALVAVSVLILVSQTSAGRGAGGAALGGARRAARFIPGVGALA